MSVQRTITRSILRKRGISWEQFQTKRYGLKLAKAFRLSYKGFFYNIRKALSI